jgi:hypothetical protein
MQFKSDTQRLTYAYLPLGNLLAMTSTLKPSSLRFYTTDRNTWDYVNTSLQPARSSTETSAFETCSGPSLQPDHAENTLSNWGSPTSSGRNIYVKEDGHPNEWRAGSPRNTSISAWSGKLTVTMAQRLLEFLFLAIIQLRADLYFVYLYR